MVVGLPELLRIRPGKNKPRAALSCTRAAQTVFLPVV